MICGHYGDDLRSIRGLMLCCRFSWVQAGAPIWGATLCVSRSSGQSAWSRNKHRGVTLVASRQLQPPALEPPCRPFFGRRGPGKRSQGWATCRPRPTRRGAIRRLQRGGSPHLVRWLESKGKWSGGASRLFGRDPWAGGHAFSTATHAVAGMDPFVAVAVMRSHCDPWAGASQNACALGPQGAMLGPSSAPEPVLGWHCAPAPPPG